MSKQSENQPENHQAWHDAPMRKMRFNPVNVEIKTNDQGIIYIHQLAPLPQYPSKITERFMHFVEKAPDQICLAARNAEGEWTKVTYGEVLEKIRSLGQFLLDQGLSQSRPLVILSGNDIEHALLGLAAVHVGIPYAPISPAYSLVAKTFDRLIDTLSPINFGMVFANDADAFAKPLDAIVSDDVKVIATKNAGSNAFDFNTALSTKPTRQVDEAHEAVTGDTIAKYLFTSGSTGTPKAVINSHGMICSAGIMVQEAFAFLKDKPPTILDWSPWHHTAGGNQNFYMSLFSGGSFYIDDGKPTPGEIHKTLRNLKEISPSWYFNVPKGYEVLVNQMEEDDDLREAFFKNLGMLWYAGASMAQHTWDALETLAVHTAGTRVLIGTGLGATETAPGMLFCTWPQTTPGNIGLPCKGVVLKLVPFEGRYEARVKGPNVTPGYAGEPELTKQAFDEEGFYKFGDALRPVDENDLTQGFYFDGRTAENFKLDTGTWVNTGALRLGFIDHFGTAAKDVAITGADSPYLGALVFPDIAEMQKIAGSNTASAAELLENEKVRAYFKQKLQSLAAQSTGSSSRIKRMLLVEVPPSLESGEMTDKGSINQRAIIRNRASSVEELYAGSSNVIEI